jgi:putative hydrolase of HD superfamily
MARSASDLAAINFFAEAGLLKKIKRSGWWVAGIKDPESVAEHCFRCAVIGYYLAHQEGADPYKVIVMTLFNDIHESRINDLHKMGHYYIDFKDAERRVFKDQTELLAAAMKEELRRFRAEYDGQRSKEGVVARDADILECLLQAKEYHDIGYKGAEKFFQKAPEFLHTKTAQRLWRKIKRWDSRSWWEHVVKFER